MLHVGAGIIDPDYCGEIMVLLFNLGKNDVTIESGQRVAQAICERVFIPEIAEGGIIYDSSQRMMNRFGSSGK